MSIIWCITGGQQDLVECSSMISRVEEPILAFSQAGERVSKMYNFYESIISNACDVLLESELGPNPAVVTRLSDIELVIVAPATSNTCAKLRFGISDSMVTNIASQAIKNRIPVAILPTDRKRKIMAKTFSGKEFEMSARDIDLENASALDADFTVLRSVDELSNLLLL